MVVRFRARRPVGRRPAHGLGCGKGSNGEERPVARTEVSGLEIEYELVGDAKAPPIALTVGGRFSKDVNGLPQLAQALVERGMRVLMWDRPNCGASQVSFDADNESEMQGRTLTALIRQLGLGPTTLAGGSGGSRVTLIAASRDPEIVSNLIVWWISGGVSGLLSLANYYCIGQALAASKGGMEAVAALPAWEEQIRKNPKNRDVILAQDPQKFIETMEKWAMVYVPQPDSPVPGMSPQDFARLTMPTLVYRSGKSDLSHPRRTSEWVHELIPGSKLAEPPWPDDQWNRGSGTSEMFACWEKLAPEIVQFVKR
jgi:pimeloyl-ACP methyl ester carboxylesterase